MFATHPLEADGVNPHFFYMLAKENKKVLQSCHVRIPPTVLFEQGFAKAVFSTETTKHDLEIGEVKKKGGKEVDLDYVYQTFARGVEDGDVCAVLMFAAQRSADFGSTRFMDKAALKKFLFVDIEKPKSLLQKFVKPKGNSNTLIHAVWSPLMVLTECRRNMHSLSDRHLPVNTRAATFEDPSAETVEVVVSQKVVKEIAETCCEVAQHFERTERIQMTRLACYFKVDANNQLRLLCSSSVRLNDGHPGSVSAPVNLALGMRKAQDPSSKVVRKDDELLREIDDTMKHCRVSVPSLPPTSSLIMRCLSPPKEPHPERGQPSGAPSRAGSPKGGTSPKGLGSPKSAASPASPLSPSKHNGVPATPGAASSHGQFPVTPTSGTPQPATGTKGKVLPMRQQMGELAAGPGQSKGGSQTKAMGAVNATMEHILSKAQSAGALPQPTQLMRFQHLLPNSAQNMEAERIRIELGTTEADVQKDWSGFLAEQERSIALLKQLKSTPSVNVPLDPNGMGFSPEKGSLNLAKAPPVKNHVYFDEATPETTHNSVHGGSSMADAGEGPNHSEPATDKDMFLQAVRTRQNHLTSIPFSALRKKALRKGKKSPSSMSSLTPNSPHTSTIALRPKLSLASTMSGSAAPTSTASFSHGRGVPSRSVTDLDIDVLQQNAYSPPVSVGTPMFTPTNVPANVMLPPGLQPLPASGVTSPVTPMKDVSPPHHRKGTLAPVSTPSKQQLSPLKRPDGSSVPQAERPQSVHNVVSPQPRKVDGVPRPEASATGKGTRPSNRPARVASLYGRRGMQAPAPVGPDGTRSVSPATDSTALTPTPIIGTGKRVTPPKGTKRETSASSVFSPVDKLMSTRAKGGLHVRIDLTSMDPLDAAEVLHQTDLMCQDLRQYCCELVYAVYCVFLENRRDAYVEIPEYFQPVLSCQHLRSILYKLHGRVVLRSEHLKQHCASFGGSLEMRTHYVTAIHSGALAQWPAAENVAEPDKCLEGECVVFPHIENVLLVFRGGSENVGPDVDPFITPDDGVLYQNILRHQYFRRLAAIEGEREAAERERQMAEAELAARSNEASSRGTTPQADLVVVGSSPSTPSQPSTPVASSPSSPPDRSQRLDHSHHEELICARCQACRICCVCTIISRSPSRTRQA